MTAKKLAAEEPDFATWLKVWEADRCCPFPLTDWLLDRGHDGLAEAAQVAAGMPEREVFLPFTDYGERDTPCGLYPSLTAVSRHFWKNLGDERGREFTSPPPEFASHLPTGMASPLKNGAYLTHKTVRDALVWYLDQYVKQILPRRRKRRPHPGVASCLSRN